MTRAKPRNLTGLVVPFFLAGCLIFGYWLYWNRAASEVENQARRALSTNGYTSAKVSGFPYRLTLEIADLNLKAQNASQFKASKVTATASPFNPFLWVLEGALDPALAFPNGPIRPLKATNLKASLRFDKLGVQRFSLTFDGIEAQGEGGWKTGKGLFHLMSRFEDDVSLAMVIDLKDTTLAQPLDGPGAILGQTINHIFVSGPINERRALMTSLDAWREAAGKLTIMAGEVIWGPISLTKATGTLALSPTNKWQGTLSGQGALKPEGVPVSGLSGPISLQINDGRLSIGGLPGFDLSNALQ
jgi:hypothetical protein